MTVGIRILIQLLAVFTIWLCRPGSALHVEIAPKPVNNLINDEVSVTCLPNDSPFWSQKVMVISVGKEGKRPLATLGNGNDGLIQYGADRKSNMKAEGRIDRNVSNSFLRLTIQKPGLRDVGVYSCHMYYLDGMAQLKEGKASANLTIDNDNDKVVILQLLQRISDLEKSTLQKAKRFDNEESKLRQDEALIATQGKDIKLLKNRAKNLETKDGNLLKTLSDIQKAATNRDRQFNDQDKNLKHQEQLVASLGNQLKNQQAHVKALHAKDGNDKSAFTNLVKRVSSLESGLAKEKITVTDQEAKLKQQDQVISDQAKQLKAQQTHANAMDAKAKKEKLAFDNLVRRVSDLEKGASQQDMKIKEQENKLKAQDKLISDQAKKIKDMQTPQKKKDDTHNLDEIATKKTVDSRFKTRDQFCERHPALCHAERDM